ncbi:hypothetical protein [Anaerosporobacter sp.]
MLKKFKNSLVVLFLLGAIVLPLSQSSSFTSSTTDGTVQICCPKDHHDAF